MSITLVKQPPSIPYPFLHPHGSYWHYKYTKLRNYIPQKHARKVFRSIGLKQVHYNLRLTPYIGNIKRQHVCYFNNPTRQTSLNMSLIWSKDFLTLEDGTDKLSQNVGTELPLSGA
jgi:hypothetical protein